MSQAVDGVPQPTLRVERVHMEAEEEEQQTHGLPELRRLVPSFRPQMLKEPAKARVHDVVCSHPDVGARSGQGHGHAVHASAADENEERGGRVTLPNRNVQPRAESTILMCPFALAEPGRVVTGRVSGGDHGPDQLRLLDKNVRSGPQGDAHAVGRRGYFPAIKAHG